MLHYFGAVKLETAVEASKRAAASYQVFVPMCMVHNVVLHLTQAFMVIMQHSSVCWWTGFQMSYLMYAGSADSTIQLEWTDASPRQVLLATSMHSHQHVTSRPRITGYLCDEQGTVMLKPCMPQS